MNNEAIERAALAEKLRHYGRDELKDGSLLRTLKDVTGGATWRDCLLRLADVADPTCTAIVDDNLNDSEGMGDVWCTCSECGGLLCVNDAPEPSYCPECGARVVRKEDDGDR